MRMAAVGSCVYLKTAAVLTLLPTLPEGSWKASLVYVELCRCDRQH